MKGKRRAPGLRLRRARRSDLALLVRHRTGMWRDIGGFERRQLEEEAELYGPWADRQFRRRRLLGWIAETAEGDVAGSGCVWLAETQPRPGEPDFFRPYILSMYTEPEFRGRGVASSVVRAAVAWARVAGFGRITLHGSKMGRPVYARLGFERTWEMRMQLRRPRVPRRSKVGHADRRARKRRADSPR